MRDVFISYSSIDSKEAYAIRVFLQRNGCTCWMAPDDIPAGSDYAEAIPRAIAECRTFVLILSPNAQNSNWVRKELGKALSKEKIVIPFMICDFKLNDTYDFLLENAQWCYAYSNRDAALKKMLDAVKNQQSTYSYKPQSGTTPPRQTPTPPKQKTAAPKPTVTQTKPRPTAAASSSSKAISVILYGLVIWGLFWSLSALLVGVCFALSEQTEMGSSAFVLLGLGMWGFIILLIVAHNKQWIRNWILDAKRGNFIQKLLLWLVLSAGILFALILILSITYLQIVNQENFTPDQVGLLAVGSGVISLAMLAGWLKKYDL